jgi:hypothetical protein
MIALATWRAATMADISAQCGVMLSKVIKLQIPTEPANLRRRHEAVNARPTA